MSLPLIDFRGKITHETDAVLEAPLPGFTPEARLKSVSRKEQA